MQKYTCQLEAGKDILPLDLRPRHHESLTATPGTYTKSLCGSESYPSLFVCLLQQEQAGKAAASRFNTRIDLESPKVASLVKVDELKGKKASTVTKKLPRSALLLYSLRPDRLLPLLEEFQVPPVRREPLQAQPGDGRQPRASHRAEGDGGKVKSSMGVICIQSVFNI